MVVTVAVRVKMTLTVITVMPMTMKGVTMRKTTRKYGDGVGDKYGISEHDLS